MITIDKLIERDLAELSGLYKQFWGEDSSIEKMKDTFRRLESNPHYIFLGAKQNGSLVGSVMGIVCEELYGECKPFMVVEDVVVDSDHRRCGVGTSLMRALEQTAAERGCSYIIFVTESDRTEAHQFYASIGYKPDGYKGFKKRMKEG